MNRIVMSGALCCALVLFSYTGTFAEDYTPTDMTAAQILSKSESAGGRLDPGSYVIVERTHSGGVDNEITTRIHGHDSATVSHYGPFTSSSGISDGQSWVQDMNGVVFLRTDFHAKADPNTNAWEHPEDPANHVTVLGITADAPHQYVIEAKPPTGTDQYAYYDTQTMLLQRVVTYARDRHKHVADYSDYRTAFGQTRAYHIHYTNGLANDESDTFVESIARDSDTSPLAIPASRSLYTFADAKPVQIPALFTRAGIIVRVTIGNRGVDLILDSGASDITLDPGVAHDLGLTGFGKRTGTMGGDYDYSDILVPDMHVAGLEMKNVQLTTLAMTNPVAGSKVVGLLGCDFIAGGILGIDFKKQTLTLYPPGSFDPVALGITSQETIDIGDFVPRVEGSVESLTANFLIDTGSFTSMLFPSFADKLPAKSGTDDQIDGFGGVGGSVRAHAVAVSDLVFGNVRYRTADIVIPGSSTFNVRDYDGIIGRNILSNYAIFLNYGSRMVYFKPEL